MAGQFVKDASKVASGVETEAALYFKGMECGASCKELCPHT